MGTLSQLFNQGLVLPCRLYPIVDLTHAINIFKYLTRLNAEKETTSQILFFENETREDKGNRMGLHAKSEIINLDTEDHKGDTYDKMIKICRVTLKKKEKMYMTTLYLGKESIPMDDCDGKTAYSYSTWTGKGFTQEDVPELLKLGMVMYRMALMDVEPLLLTSCSPVALVYHLKQKGNNGKTNPPHMHFVFSM